MIVDLPGLRNDVRALRVPRGLLLHDPLRWRLFAIPAGLEGEALRAHLVRSGLHETSAAPARRGRLCQLFWLPLDQIPEGPLRLAERARFACVCCGTSCRTMKLGPLLPADVERLRRADWTGTGHDPKTFFVDGNDGPLEPGAQPFLRRGEGGCQFLRDDQLCEVHARFGAETKPLMCRVFPYVFRGTPTGVVVSLRLGECASAPRTSLGLPVVEQQPELRAMLREHDRIALAPPSLWARPDRLIAWEEYDRLETALLSRPAQRAAGEIAAAVLDTFGTAAADPAALAEMKRRAGLDAASVPPSLDDAAVELEDRLCRAMIFNKELLVPQDLAWGAAILVAKAHLARLEAEDGSAEALNAAWKNGAARPFRELCAGLDLGGIAAAIARA